MRSGIISAAAWSSSTPSATPPTTCRGWPIRCDRGSVSTLFEHQAPHPLADLLRPRSLAEVVGEDHLLGPDAPIGRMVANRKLSSMILWGPDRKSTRLNSSHANISYAGFCLKK